MFRFESPHYFYFISLIPLILISVFFLISKRQKNLYKFFGTRVGPFLLSSVSNTRRRVKVILQLTAAFFMIVALARPQSGASEQKIKSEGVEIVFLADVSDSMMAEDVRPNRLGQMRVELSRLVDLLGGNKIGLVAFAGSATLLSPLTTDPSALKMYIDSLATTSVSSQGTNFQAALAEAEEAFARGGVGQDESSRVTRVIIVASDGEDHEPGALELAKKMANQGTRIFALIYGTEKGSIIPDRDSLGFLKGYKKDEKGQDVVTTVKGEELTALASAGQGEVFFASLGGLHLKRLISSIDQLEKSQFDSKLTVQYKENFQIPLFLAFLIFCFELILGERKTPFRLWRGRFEVPPA